MFKTRINPKRIITVGGTLFCAWGIGYLMQSNAQQAAPSTSELSAPPVEVDPLVRNEGAPLKLTDITLTSAILPPTMSLPGPAFFPDAPIVRAKANPDRPINVLPEEEAAPTFACKTTLTAEPRAAAMVALTVDAPCFAAARFTLHHNGMMFTDVTDENGRRNLTVPALTEDAVYMVTFSPDDGAIARVSVGTLEYYDRVVVQWAGQSGLQIHAFEFDADYESAGHVWADDTRESSVAARGQGGFIARYGAPGIENPYMAEVYTFPSGTSRRQGEVRLSLEAEVTTANCGHDIEAQSIQLGQNGRLQVRDLMLAMPDCSAEGDFLVLKNVLNDLKIASN